MRGFVYLLVIASLSGCAFWKSPGKKEAAKKMATESFLGTVSMVNEDGRFVLVDFGGFAAPVPGAELQARRAGETVATLKAGGEIRRPFAAADIMEGTPQVGDDIWSKNPTP